MRSAGVSFAKIGDALGIKETTVKMFITRNKDNDARRADIMLQAKPWPKIAPIAVAKREQRSLADMLMVTARATTRALLRAHNRVYSALADGAVLSDDEKFQVKVALEYVKGARLGDIKMDLPKDVTEEDHRILIEIVEPDATH